MIERFAQMPAALRAHARWERLGSSAIPALLVHPDWDSGRRVPTVIWMHGRTAHKELDPGRYLRWMRAGHGGMAACALDLPGHGERLDVQTQDRTQTMTIVKQMVEEIDQVIDALSHFGVFDMQRLGIGGMSAGGMAALARLCRPHPFRAAAVEATTGSWQHWRDDQTAAHLNPIEHLDGWREIPVLAIHARGDQWIPFDEQAAFIEALRGRYADPSVIELLVFDHTGAAGEHIGFGRHAAEAKDRQREFFTRWL